MNRFVKYIEIFFLKISRYQIKIDEIYLILKRLLFKGKTYYCPCCNSFLRKFFPYGNNKKRYSVLCPVCGSSERTRLFLIYFKQKTDIFTKNLKFLHIAPNITLQRILKNLNNLTYISGDLHSPVAMIKLDITKINFNDNYFDVILCSHVLEHIPNDYLALKELYRVLKPKGWAILQVPIDHNRAKTFENSKIISPKERLRVFGHKDHVRIYGTDYKDRLERVGFIVKLDNFAKNIDKEKLIKYGLRNSEIIYRVFKS